MLYVWIWYSAIQNVRSLVGKEMSNLFFPLFSWITLPCLENACIHILHTQEIFSSLCILKDQPQRLTLIIISFSPLYKHRWAESLSWEVTDLNPERLYRLIVSFIISVSNPILSPSVALLNTSAVRLITTYYCKRHIG